MALIGSRGGEGGWGGGGTENVNGNNNNHVLPHIRKNIISKGGYKISVWRVSDLALARNQKVGSCPALVQYTPPFI